MTQNHGRRIILSLKLPHGLCWLLLIVTLLLRLSPLVASQIVTLPPPQPPAPTGFNPLQSKIKVSPKMTIVLICFMSVFLLLACASFYIRQCLSGHLSPPLPLDGAAAGGLRWSGLDAAVIDSFPTFFYSEVKGLKIGQAALECAVCLNEFEDHETLRLLPICSHVFHQNCIDTWLSSHVTCPVCRANLVPRPGESLPFTELSHDSESEPGQDSQNQNFDPAVDDLILHVQSPDTEPVEADERFTLRLPEEVRNCLMRSSLSRTRSCVVLPRVMSSRKGYRSSSVGTGLGRNFFSYERFDRVGRTDGWEFKMTPPFISRTVSAKGDGGGEELTATPMRMLKFAASPFKRFFGSSDSNGRLIR